MPRATVSRLLGHTSIETTFVYLGVAEETLPEDVQRYEEARAAMVVASNSDGTASDELSASVH